MNQRAIVSKLKNKISRHFEHFGCHRPFDRTISPLEVAGNGCKCFCGRPPGRPGERPYLSWWAGALEGVPLLCPVVSKMCVRLESAKVNIKPRLSAGLPALVHAARCPPSCPGSGAGTALARFYWPAGCRMSWPRRPNSKSILHAQRDASWWRGNGPHGPKRVTRLR